MKLLLVVASIGIVAVFARGADASAPSDAERYERDRWLAARFPRLARPPDVPAAAIVVRQRLDFVTQNGYVNGRFTIGGDVYYRGLQTHAPSELVVRLPSPGQSFEALFGVDSNEMTAVSSGSVVGHVSADGEEKALTPVLTEGMAATPVSADLNGATEFVLAVDDAGDGIACDQAVWAEAVVTLENGERLWLGDLPIIEGQPGPEPGEGAPFSFAIGGRPAADVLPDWSETHERRSADGATVWEQTYRDSETGIAVTVELTRYDAFPTIDWTVHLSNEGDADTPLIEDFLALDAVFARRALPLELGEFVLHHHHGDGIGPESFGPQMTDLPPGAEARFAPPGGRPSSHVWPYFNIEWWSEGIVMAVGWPGQWATSFTRDEAEGLRIQAGQEHTRFRLKPGESIRSPRIALQFYKGDPTRAQNVWRRWMLAHNTPRPHGAPPRPMSLGTSYRVYGEMVGATAENQIEFIRRYVEERIPIDYWWMDAGWYVGAVEHGWPRVGTWDVDRQRFPDGLRAVSDFAHERAIKTLLWFEPERVQPGSWLWEAHPEWLLRSPARPEPNPLLNLGHPEAREWLVDHVSRALTEEGIDLYRQDFNVDPLSHWRGGDEEGREGLTEANHLAGYLAYWDELLRQHPGMLIDTCASGGRRDDIESLRRAIPLWRSDYGYEPIGNQCQTYGLAMWVPYFGAGNMAYPDAYYGEGATPVEPYAFWSNCYPSVALPFDMRAEENDYAAIRRLLEQRAAMVDCMLGDFYPLTAYSSDDDVWLAWQFDLPEADEGVVQAFRRPRSIFESARMPLRALDPNAEYRLRDFASGRKWRCRGEELLQRGVPIAIADRPGASIVKYERVGPRDG